MAADPKKLMGFETSADKKVPIRTGDWDAMKLALWRANSAWETIAREATVLLEACKHADGCPGKEDEFKPCLPGCPDREKRLSALVILGASKQCAPIDAKKVADGPYFAPSREYFSEVIAELAAAQIEIERLRVAAAVTTTTETTETP
jgi:hypothetical protein